MNYMKKILYILMPILIGFSLTSCNTQIKKVEKTPYYSISIDGEKTYHSESEESVKRLKELTESYLMNSAQSDYQNLDLVNEEMNFYSIEYQKSLESYGFVKSVQEQLTRYQLQNEVSDYKIISIQLCHKHNQPMATVTCEYITSIKHATEEYLRSMSVKTDTNYKRVLTMDVVLEDGTWKISNYSNTPREEV